MTIICGFWRLGRRCLVIETVARRMGLRSGTAAVLDVIVIRGFWGKHA
jgi:hypothetical protein